MAVSFLKGIDDDHCFDAEATMVTSKNIQNLKCLYNYKCFVSGGERFFIMGLGVSVTVYVAHVRHEIVRHALSASHGLLRSPFHRRDTV